MNVPLNQARRQWVSCGMVVSAILAVRRVVWVDSAHPRSGPFYPRLTASARPIAGGWRTVKDSLHTTLFISDASFAAELTGFTTGLLITGLLLVLTLRAAKLPGTPLTNIVFAICGLLWSAGGLAETVLVAMGID